MLQKYGIPEMPVGQYFATGAIAAWTPPGGGTIYVAAQHISDNSLDHSQALVMHELIHEAFGKVDTDIQAALGVTVGAASANITTWLKDNCIK
jgi:hypothetical protein